VTGYEVVFALLGVIAAGGGVLVVTTRNVVRAALWLVVALGAVAGCYLMLAAEFVAVVQLLIYVGAVVVLLLFAVMFTRAPVGPADDLDTRNAPVAVVVALATAALLITLLAQAFGTAYVDLNAGQPGSAETIGSTVFRTWVLPFEVVSVLLLAALIGAIVLSRPEIGTREHR
jgi:NADH-quinone oxidoreductase subunit J